MSEIEVDGLEELIEAIEKAPETFLPIAKEAMEKTCIAVISRVNQGAYPPASDANRPGRVDQHGNPMGYYERGDGWYEPVREKSELTTLANEAGGYGKARGLKKAKKAQRGQGVWGYKRTTRSERLGQHWAFKVEVKSHDLEGAIGNPVTYYPEVEGLRQKAIHAMRGWPRIDTALADAQEDIAAAWVEALDELAKIITESE